jgi:hypothetical protein
MANQQAMCTSFLGQLLNGGHQFGTITLVSRTSLTAPTKDTFKAALYLATATVNASTTAYSATNEVTGTNYSAGGITVTNANPPATSNISIATTAASGTGSVVTLTFATQTTQPFAAGSYISVAGVTPAGYNGTYLVTGGSTSTVTYAGTTTGAQTVAGTITAATAGTAYWTPSDSLIYTNVTLLTAFDTVLIYNSTQNNTAVSVHTFGSQTITSGTFTLTMPTNGVTTALLRLATT